MTEGSTEGNSSQVPADVLLYLRGVDFQNASQSGFWRIQAKKALRSVKKLGPSTRGEVEKCCRMVWSGACRYCAATGNGSY
jgi:hypothetical protein